jgi:hypothetical protein
MYVRHKPHFLRRSLQRGHPYALDTLSLMLLLLLKKVVVVAGGGGGGGGAGGKAKGAVVACGCL